MSGRVVAGDRPVQGASIRISDYDRAATTNAEGEYSFIVPASHVRGQAATIVARHVHYGTRTATIRLVGGTIVQDFVFDGPEGSASNVAGRDPTGAVVAVAGAPRQATRPMQPGLRTADSTVLSEAAGPLDMASALAGRIPGLQVTAANSPGASSFMAFRGTRSIVASNQPLVVVDGVPIDNSSSATASQQFGLGGFDYGSPLQDIPLDDIASVTLLTGAEAAVKYGMRGANGVLLVTSKRGRGLTGFEVSASVRRTGESPVMLPSYQNQYGQGLGGKFEFFNGAGGGVNDGVDQSWGPALHGQPVAQASLTQPGRAEVRQWLPHPDGVKNYFTGASTIDANAALQGSASWGDLRLALNGRDASGVLPTNDMRRLAATINSTLRPSDQFSFDANLRVVGSNSTGRPGTGFDEINPVAGFTRFGRQVDLDALRSHVKDSTQQINWIYTNRDNPYFQTSLNTNHDNRAHVIGGAAATFSITNALKLVARAGTDVNRATRDFDVQSGWKGGYPTVLGRSDFSGGGSQRQTLNLQQTLGGLELVTATGHTSSALLTSSLGVEYRTESYDGTTAIVDRTAGVSGGATPTNSLSGSDNVSSVDLGNTLSLGDAFRLSAGARADKMSTGGSHIYPSVGATYHVLRLGAPSDPTVASLHGAWWQAGNELASRVLTGAYTGAAVSCGTLCSVASPTVPSLGMSSTPAHLGPELTQGKEIGTTLSTVGGRMTLDVTAYDERSSNLLFAATSASAITSSQTGVISNRGIEAGVRAEPIRSGWLGWDVSLSYSKNSSRVDALGSGVSEVPLGPTLWGAALVARPGQPLGSIVGTRFLRDASGALLLTNGHPVSDLTPSVLGSWQPDWMGSAANTIRVGRAELSALVDARMGGRIFSATNLWGSYSGTLESTVNRPANGLLIAGVDNATKQANTTTVSAEDYFHALGAINEAWVYDASFVKLRDVRVAYTLPLTSIAGFRAQTVRIALVGRNLATWAKAPNIDPETTLSTGSFQGFEMGQLPTTRSVGLQLTIAP